MKISKFGGYYKTWVNADAGYSQNTTRRNRYDRRCRDRLIKLPG